MNWIEFSIKTTGQAVEAISEVFNRFGANGVAINDPSDLIIRDNESIVWDYIDESLKSKEDYVQVKAYYSKDENTQLKIEEIKKAILSIGEYLDLGEALIEIKTVNDEDWANEWKKYYKPLKIGSRILVKPSWEQVESHENEVIVELDPGMAFGTGTHESTRMCMELLDQYIKDGDEMLDVGCGSGILSITGAKLGASRVFAIDIDPVAVKTSQENIERNHISHIVTVQKSVIEEIKIEKFNVVAANIVADVIIGISDQVKEFLKSDGIFIVSGIIKDRAEDVQNKLFESGYKLIEKKSDGEWVAMAASLK